MGDMSSVDLGGVIEELVGGSAFARRLGLRLVSLGDEHAEVELPFDAGNVTVGEMVHGGAIAALIDVAAVAASWSGVNVDSPPSGGATLSASVNYLSPARGDDPARVRAGHEAWPWGLLQRRICPGRGPAAGRTSDRRLQVQLGVAAPASESRP
jgi:uncharacterized protein (TIGR00369 family)